MGRFATAWRAFWEIIGSAEASERWLHVSGAGSGGTADAEPREDAAEATEGMSADAVYTLVLLQREGRLVDFLLEDIDAYSDADVGTAVRQIHANCRKVLESNFGVTAVRAERENERVEIPEGFDPRHVRLLGKPTGAPPFSGILKHHGWRVTKVDFPERHEKLDPSVICAAEVEV